MQRPTMAYRKSSRLDSSLSFVLRSSRCVSTSDAQAESCSDLAGRQTLGDEPNHLEFGVAQALEAGGGSWLHAGQPLEHLRRHSLAQVDASAQDLVDGLD